ncbi:MAG: hypothetical protein WAM19_08865 [Nitrososphaeraceae archaeon]
MEPLMKLVIMIFSVVPALLVGQLFIGFISVDAQNMSPGNMMGSNMTGNMTGNMMGGSAKMHLEEGIKALESGNIQAANMHLDFARQAMANSPTNAVKHFEEGMKALGAGDSNGALMHLKLADQALG